MSLPPRRWFLYAAVALAFAAGVWFLAFHAQAKRPGNNFGGFRKGGAQPIPVRAVAAQRQELPVYLRAIGTVVPLNTVHVRSRVDGPLLRVLFQEGQQVEKGQVLAEVDPVPYRIRLAEAEAQVRQGEAQLLTARSDLDRLKPLAARNLVTPQQLEAQQAIVAQREASVAADQAQVEDARRQLAYTSIEAPIPGRVGLRQVDPGNLIRSNDANGLVVITQTRPITVMFTVPEIDLHKVLDPLRAGEALHVEAWDRGEDRLLASGSLRTIDNQIDLATGTLRLKAEFPNDDEKLFPNQFVNVRLRVRTIRDALVVPSAAIQFGSRGTYVYIVNAQNQASVRDVVLGPAGGDSQSIVKGIDAGDKVILEGLDRLREGRPVMLVGDQPAAGVGKKSPDAPASHPGAASDESPKQNRRKGKSA
jgi:multidrug efflux system membrane fusion protein